MFHTRFSPDPPEGAAPTTEGGVTHRPGIPQGNVDFMNVSKDVAAAWLANPTLTLLWTTQGAFSTIVTNYSNTLTGRLTTGAGRSLQTQTLDNLDSEIDHAIGQVKVYIADAFTKEMALSYYPQFGIEHHGTQWEMTPDHTERSQKLQMMIDAIAANGLGTKPFGTTFWTNIKTQFDAALASAGTIDGSVSVAVGTQNSLKSQINKVMIALRFLLRANYPDTYKNMYRDWGWQKEDY